MQKYFATKSRNLHLNSGANVVRFAPLFKCKRLPRAGKRRKTGNGRSGATMFEDCNNVGSLGKPTRGENLDAFAPRLDCKMGTSLHDLTAKSVSKCAAPRFNCK